MRKTAIFSTLALAAALALGGGAVDTASAKPGWKGGGPHGFHQGAKAGWHGAHRPPGWSHGRKRGWHKGSAHRGRVPPGWR